MDINGNQWNMYWLWMACWIGYPPVSSNIGWEIRKIPSKSGCVSQEIELELGDFQFFRRGHWSFSSYYGQKNITEIIPIFFCFLLYDPKLYYYSQIILFPWCFFIVWSYDPKLVYWRPQGSTCSEWKQLDAKASPEWVLKCPKGWGVMCRSPAVPKVLGRWSRKIASVSLAYFRLLPSLEEEDLAVSWCEHWVTMGLPEIPMDYHCLPLNRLTRH